MTRDDRLAGPGHLIMPGGWSAPKDRAPGWPFPNLLIPIRGGMKYPQPQKEPAMSNTEAQDLAIAAAAKRVQAKKLIEEAKELEYRHDALTMPRVTFDSDGPLTVTQAQLHFIHTRVFALDSGMGHVVPVSGGNLLQVTAGDERWTIDEGANVISAEGFDPFDRDWTTK